MHNELELLDCYSLFKGYPAQEAAIQWLEQQLNREVLQEFSDRYRQKPERQSIPPDVHLELTWQGAYHISGFRIFRLALVENNSVIGKVPVLSGDLSTQTEAFVHPAEDWRGSLRCLPEGIYSIGRVEDSQLMRSSVSFGAGIGRFWIGLESLSGSQVNQRSGFGIHADADASYSPGSAGSICPFDNEGFERILEWMKRKHRPTQLTCDLGTGFLAAQIQAVNTISNQHHRIHTQGNGSPTPCNQPGKAASVTISKRLIPEDYQAVAKQLGVETAVIRAVVEVESKGGFLESGRPKILFEAQWFGKFTGDRYNNIYPDISKYTWDRSQYLGGEKEWQRFDKAAKLDRNAAIQATSFGLFQIMGMNFSACGYDTPESFYQAACTSEREHLNMFTQFIRSKGLEPALRQKDWQSFAYGYNGEAYRLNQYHLKLVEAYRKYAN